MSYRWLNEEYAPRGAREGRTDRHARRGTGKFGDRPGKVAWVGSTPPAAKSATRKQIERALNGDTAGGELSRRIAHALLGQPRVVHATARGMLYALERRGSPIVTDGASAAIVARLARLQGRFVRPFAEFASTESDAARAAEQLAAHLLARWSVPHWLRDAWARDNVDRHAWYAHLGAGQNLSTAPNLPYPLTRRMAHHAVGAPSGLTWSQALRWGQARGLDVPEELCHEIVRSRLSGALPQDDFWRSVVAWFAVHPEVIGHVGQIVDYLFAMRLGDFAEPVQRDITMRGRSPDRLMADVRAWHRTLTRWSRQSVPTEWLSCGLSGAAATPVDVVNPAAATRATLPNWAIVELCRSRDLEREGEVLHHCVATYAPSAATGRVAIFSLRRLVEGALKPAVTIEVWPAQREIVQARGLQNAYPEASDRKLIESWAKSNGLSFQPAVFGIAATDRRLLRRMR